MMNKYVCITGFDMFKTGEVVLSQVLNTGVGDDFYTIYKLPFEITKILLKNEFKKHFVTIETYRECQIDKLTIYG